MGWDTDSCRRLYWDMTPTLFFETLYSLGPDNLVTFDWPDTSEATDCFPAVHEQDPSIWMNWHTAPAALSQDSWCCCMQRENDCPVNSWNRIQTWVTDYLISHPTGYHHTIFLLVFGVGKLGSLGSLYNHTCATVVTLLAVWACICSVKDISWSWRAVVCAVIWVVNLSSQEFISMSILGLQPEFLLMVRTPFSS